MGWVIPAVYNSNGLKAAEFVGLGVCLFSGCAAIGLVVIDSYRERKLGKP